MQLHAGLAQQAPGSDASTKRALGLVPPLLAGARILDVGCGPGRQTLVLARETSAHVLAVDVMEEYLAQLKEEAVEEGLADRIETRALSMTEFDFEPGSFDLVWSEGAIYIVGFEAGLAAWRPLVKPGGHVVVSELSWLVDRRPASAEAFWRTGYPAMGDVSSNCERAERAGYAVRHYFALPDMDWWEYYRPLERRLPSVREAFAGNPEALAHLDETAREIQLYRDHSGSYGYVFYVLQRQ